MNATVTAVHTSPAHTFGKIPRDHIEVLAGLGVRGDAHLGTTVQHRSRVARDPTQPNLRQVHLIHAELHTELAAAGMPVAPGAMGENITTGHIALLDLPTGTRLHLGPHAVIEITGLRNPCVQLNGLHPHLMAAVAYRDATGALIRTAGVMATVTTSGLIRPGDTITTHLPAPPHRPLKPV